MADFSQQESERVRDEANAWIARFAPLILDNEPLTENEVRHRIATSQILQEQGQNLQSRLMAIEESDPDLIKTFRSAVGELESIENEYRIQLGRLVPGDPEGMASLEAVNDRLAERLARKEMGLTGTASMPDVLELKTSPGNIGAALGLGIFGLGWNSFTAVHASFMIGGMYQEFGWAALGLLAFYGIFFTVGFGMWLAAFHAASTEEIHLDGQNLTVIRRLGPITRKRTFLLPDQAEAVLSEMEMPRVGNRQSNRPMPVIQLHDIDGNPIGLGSTSTDVQRRQNLEKINAYLKLHDHA